MILFFGGKGGALSGFDFRLGLRVGEGDLCGESVPQPPVTPLYISHKDLP